MLQRKYVVALALALIPLVMPNLAKAQHITPEPSLSATIEERPLEEPILDDTGQIMIEGNALVANSVNAEIAYQNWIKENEAKKRIRQKITTKVKVASKGYDPCSCVSYARWFTGIYTGSIGVARNHPINRQDPVIGAIMVTRESGAGHVMGVTGYDDTYVYFSEANYTRCQVGTRKLPLNSSLIRGYYKP